MALRHVGRAAEGHVGSARSLARLAAGPHTLAVAREIQEALGFESRGVVGSHVVSRKHSLSWIASSSASSLTSLR